MMRSLIISSDDILEQISGHVPQHFEFFVMVAKFLPFPVAKLNQDEEEDQYYRAEDGACVLELSVDVCEL
jgi:hypothetical protein